MAPAPSDQDLLAEAKRLAMAVARNVAARLEKADDEHAPALVTAFERATLVLRRTILLANHLAALDAKRDDARTTGRKRILRQVADAIAARNLPADTATELRVELIERVETPGLREDLDADILAGRTTEVVENLKRDLGVSLRALGTNTPRRTPGDVSALLAIARGTSPLPTGELRHSIPP